MDGGPESLGYPTPRARAASPSLEPRKADIPRRLFAWRQQQLLLPVVQKQVSWQDQVQSSVVLHSLVAPPTHWPRRRMDSLVRVSFLDSVFFTSSSPSLD